MLKISKTQGYMNHDCLKEQRRYYELLCYLKEKTNKYLTGSKLLSLILCNHLFRIISKRITSNLDDYLQNKLLRWFEDNAEVRMHFRGELNYI